MTTVTNHYRYIIHYNTIQIIALNFPPNARVTRKVLRHASELAAMMMMMMMMIMTTSGVPRNFFQEGGGQQIQLRTEMTVIWGL